jgi:hypothetical protein
MIVLSGNLQADYLQDGNTAVGSVRQPILREISGGLRNTSQLPSLNNS